MCSEGYNFSRKNTPTAAAVMAARFAELLYNSVPMMMAPTMYEKTLLTLMLMLKRWTTCPCCACCCLCGACACAWKAFLDCAFFAYVHEFNYFSFYGERWESVEQNNNNNNIYNQCQFQKRRANVWNVSNENVKKVNDLWINKELNNSKVFSTNFSASYH